ncbi:hypothetical protein Q7A53_15665 [Halobacillus rhizosphaerae]|uniref:hypothetical protein n=1 Tax=Halobacillus rhizosphaerae TaxID=3064889 RepID=UPI00398B0F0F
MEEKTSIKEVIFNKHRHSNTKKALGILLIILIALPTNEKFENALLLLVTFTGSIFYLCKLSIYNTKRSNHDIIMLIIYVGFFIALVLLITLTDF